MTLRHIQSTRKANLNDKTYLFNLGELLETDLVVILDIGELLLSKVDSGLCNEVDLSLLKLLVELIYHLVETRSFDLGRLVHKRHTEQFSFATLVRPCFDVRFLSDACLDCPVVLVRAQCIDGIDGPAT